MKEFGKNILIIALVCAVLGYSFQGLTGFILGTTSSVGGIVSTAIKVFSPKGGRNGSKYYPIGSEFTINPFNDWGVGKHDVYKSTDIAEAKNIAQKLLNEKRNWVLENRFVPGNVYDDEEFEEIRYWNAFQNSGRPKYYCYILMYLTETDYEYLKTILNF